MVISLRLKDARINISFRFVISTLVMPRIPFVSLELGNQRIASTYLLINRVIANSKESTPIVVSSLPSSVASVLWRSVSIKSDKDARALTYADIWVKKV